MKDASKPKMIEVLMAIQDTYTKDEITDIVNNFQKKIQQKEDVSQHYITSKKMDIIEHLKRK